jgi:thiamine biosynthesis lipoprotein
MQQPNISKFKPTAKLPLSLQFEAIGTIWTIDLYRAENTLDGQQLRQRIRRRINDFDRYYSRFRSDSLITKMSSQAGSYRLPRDAQPLFNLYERIYQETDGLVTPLIGQLLVDAGYDATYSLKPGVLRPVPAWADVIDYAYPNLTLKQPALLDFGAAGKGYLVDIIGGLLKAQGVTAFCVNAGGDILHYDGTGPALEVALEDPADPRQAIGVATIANQSICGSAGNRRAWGNYHHIMNPLSRASPRAIEAVWVVAATALLADAMATCLFFVPAAQMIAAGHEFEYAIIGGDYSLEQSSMFPAHFFSAEDAN